ncbi:flagellar basal body rod protein FlgG [Thalassobacillus sp. CUG 92003]|uniref:flagellar basal body rod protein FlgG n=1 Tax=Thalassobacillus sp. CUG 92003 TaxID=2736641 RepID=UPI0015E655EF|nr:flagellar basal body rod protein FlgG [Thalassobacillus sp. CUG 92003]
MLRSMYSGIAGMKGFQTKLDTIGNNIANVNTYGYKKGRTTFQDMMSQTVSGAQGPTAGGGGNLRGGVNPSQVGLGSKLGSIDNIHTQGNRQTTNRPLDMAIEGDGMFVVAEGTEANGIDPDTQTVDMEANRISFTRAGNFYLDNDGSIVNGNGQYLVGESPGVNGPSTIQIPEDAESFSIENNGTVNYVDAAGETQVAGEIRLAKFSNPGGLQKSGSNMYQMTDNAGAAVDGAGNLNLLAPGEEGTGQTVSGALEMSNVDLSEAFTEMITAQRGFQANTRIITTSDEIMQELVNLKR